ncbi:MAG: imidazole glycerol phosphate synthase subunit HisH [Gammaproteobacteria bacterium]
MSLVAVVDYGGSNLRSVAKALEAVAGDRVAVRIVDDAAALLGCDRVVFPGQGAIGDCMRGLTERGLISAIQECRRTRPFFGICLGLQSLMETSDEDGGTPCLAAFAGNVRRFRANAGPGADRTPRKIPHMGWNQVEWMKSHPVTRGVPSGTRFYFVHSYYVVPDDPSCVMGRTEYIDPFVSALGAGFVFATQFHPEKSAAVGLQLLRNFSHWNGEV